ncbi:MAG: hypothetical protein Q7T56_12200 [Nocardioidaceae bacterium]|nr:hypothetical protein [Nocardioidaceae bacterium]
MSRPWLAPARLGTGAVVLAALAVGQVVNTYLPENPQASRAFEREGVVGRPIEMRPFTVEVTDVEGAEQVQPQTGTSWASPGLVLVVTFTVTPSAEPRTVQWAELRSGSRTTAVTTFGQRGRLDCPVGVADLPSRCVATIESAPGALPGSRLALAPNLDDDRWDDVAVVDLGISRADVDAWRDAEPMVLPETGLVGAL